MDDNKAQKRPQCGSFGMKSRRCMISMLLKTATLSGISIESVSMALLVVAAVVQFNSDLSRHECE